MKYTLKCATGLFRIRCVSYHNAPHLGTSWYEWEIRKCGTAIPRVTARPLTTFADIYRANHAFGLI